MKILKVTVSCLLLCAMLIGGVNFSAYAQGSSTPVFPSETNSFVGDFLIEETDQDAPFFEEILPQIAANIKENNKHAITPHFSKLPQMNNPENFQGVASTSYANINGKTVYAEAFYRLFNESPYDPNCGMGLLIYQCIQYKLAHPEADVKIGYSSYRTSATASVCVLPESKYYGYMRSLYGTNYDEHGFVRISYMLVEAARMGIEVTMICQLPTYGVQQYDPSDGKLHVRKNIDYRTYFNAALKTDCYNKYAEGQKVSDYLDFVPVGWTVSDQTENMQHTKSAIVSHYLATDGTEHTSGVFVSSSNFDENNYKGANGNNNSQSGAIISDHDELFRVTYNYYQLMKKYSYKEGMQEFRRAMVRANEEQIALIKSGRGDEIPSAEQIVYLGTENDPIFQMYFTPLGGAQDTWDLEHNPICQHMNNFAASEDYVEFVWIHAEYARPYTGKIIEQILKDKYCNEPNPQNKIVTKAEKLQIDEIKELELGTEIGYCDIQENDRTHSKDIMMSYQLDGTRHYVSIMTSCNYYMIAFNIRANSILVINETDETGNGFYRAFGSRYSYGMIDLDANTGGNGSGGNNPEQGGNGSGGNNSEQGGNGSGGNNPEQGGNGSSGTPEQGGNGSNSTVTTGSETSSCDHVDDNDDFICDTCDEQINTVTEETKRIVLIVSLLVGCAVVIVCTSLWSVKRKANKGKLPTSSEETEE